MIPKAVRRTLYVVVVVIAVSLLIWGSDRITLQGERTIYTVECEQGVWQDNRCTGRLVAGERYAFRASPRRHEVLYWVRNSNAPSGKYSDCAVTDRNNWSCNVQVGQLPSIAYELKDGRPTRSGGGLTMAFHDVPKWKWWLIDIGVSVFREANN
jgi:hypothetical protein